MKTQAHAKTKAKTKANIKFKTKMKAKSSLLTKAQEKQLVELNHDLTGTDSK